MYWEAMEADNHVMRRVDKESDILVIDLVKQIPKSSHYFCDVVDFASERLPAIAEIINRSLYPRVSEEVFTVCDTPMSLTVHFDVRSIQCPSTLRSMPTQYGKLAEWPQPRSLRCKAWRVLKSVRRRNATGMDRVELCVSSPSMPRD